MAHTVKSNPPLETMQARQIKWLKSEVKRLTTEAETLREKLATANLRAVNAERRLAGDPMWRTGTEE